jgi:hypothetical protein
MACVVVDQGGIVVGVFTGDTQAEDAARYVRGEPELRMVLGLPATVKIGDEVAEAEELAQ